MMRRSFLPTLSIAVLGTIAAHGPGLVAADPETGAAAPAAAKTMPGEIIFKTYCAACHGPEGAGLVGPNLTDNVFLHGGRREDIHGVITKGVDGKGMPSWQAILSPQQIDDVADFAFSLIGKNLKSPFAPGESNVTPFPMGSLVRPLLMRSFMPLQGLDDAFFAHHHRGHDTPKYDPTKGSDVPGTVKAVDGMPSAIAVSFGERLAYCFDATECRLAYTWSGGFMDMTRYWGPGAGGGRKEFNYVPVVMGTMAYVAKGAEPLRLAAGAAAPEFKGYRKVKGAPEYHYSIGGTDFTLLITPGETAGTAICHFTATGAANGLVFAFPADEAAFISCDKGAFAAGTLTLNAAQAADFTITIAPDPAVAAAAAEAKAKAAAAEAAAKAAEKPANRAPAKR